MQTKATPHVAFGKPVNMFRQKNPPHETQTFGAFFIVEPTVGLLHTVQFPIRIAHAHMNSSFSSAFLSYRGEKTCNYLRNAGAMVLLVSPRHY
jgi:hypothetical protein